MHAPKRSCDLKIFYCRVSRYDGKIPVFQNSYSQHHWRGWEYRLYRCYRYNLNNRRQHKGLPNSPWSGAVVLFPEAQLFNQLTVTSKVMF